MPNCKGNVLLFGASGDIGIAIAQKLAQQGYQLILHYHKNRDQINATRKELPPESILMEFQADLSNDYNILACLEEIVYPVDFLVFASGAADYGLFQDVSKERMDEMLALHVKAPWLITQKMIKPMIQKGTGKIILITSVWGDIGASNEVLYSSVKGAQNSFVKALAKELGPSGIQVNAVSPGFIETKMNQHLANEEKEQIIQDIPLNRAGTPDDVANMVHFLLSDESTYVHGQIIQVSGGW